MLTRYVQRNLTWIDCVSPTAAEVRSLMHEFSIDPLIAEELLLPSYKSKVEKRGDVIYVILHFPTLQGGHQAPEQEIDFLIGKHFLITTRYENIDPLHTFAKIFEVELLLHKEIHASHGGHLFISLVRNLYQAIENGCTTMHRRLHDIEERIFSGDERRMVAELSRVGRTIHDFRQSLAPHEEMLRSFEPVGTRTFGSEFAYYIRDLEGAYGRIERTLNHLYGSLTELRETNNSLLSTKQNEIMKIFTVLTFLFLPLSFIAGLFGMNTQNNPVIGNSYDFWIIVGIMMVLACCFLIYFRRKDWL
ncbi:CorA family divalent cation transporter [Patescibacteria group bacterium]|nr:CorA family divalent cation transporter [Patescibacteria group bacterium]